MYTSCEIAERTAITTAIVNVTALKIDFSSPIDAYAQALRQNP